MKKILHSIKIFVCMFILLSPHPLFAAAVEMQNELPLCDNPNDTCKTTDTTDHCTFFSGQNGTCYTCGHLKNDDGTCVGTWYKLTCKDGYQETNKGCTECIAGSFCKDGVSNQCEKNSYSPAGATECTKCPAKFPLTAASGANSINSCYTVLEPGKYYDGGEIQPCTHANYCTGGLKIHPDDKDQMGLNPCPDAECNDEESCKNSGTQYHRTTYPDNYYNADGGLTLIKAWFNTSANTGLTNITQCNLSYSYRNKRGTFNQDSVRYQATTGHYEGDGGVVYYTALNPGYYGNVQLTSDYCNTNKDKRRHYYQHAEPCPAGKYCTGLDEMPLCSDDTYSETIGITGSIDGGYYSTGGGTSKMPTAPGDGCLDNFSCGKCDAGIHCPTGSSTNTQQCPQGYYCADEIEKCPAGTTSNAGAKKINECFIKGGADGTEFCNNDSKCFNLPNNIYYETNKTIQTEQN